MSIFLSLPPAKNATIRLSGDQNGADTPSVSGSICAVSASSGRTQSMSLSLSASGDEGHAQPVRRDGYGRNPAELRGPFAADLALERRRKRPSVRRCDRESHGARLRLGAPEARDCGPCECRHQHRRQHGNKRPRKSVAVRARRRSGDNLGRAGMRGERIQGEGQIAGRLEARGGILLQTPIDDARQCGRDGSFRGRQIAAGPLSGSPSSCRRRVAREERAAARQHLVQHGAEGEDVRTMVGRRDRAPAPATCNRSCRGPRPAACRAADVGSALAASAAGSRSASFARPKSRIFARPSSMMKMFSGFRSRWTIPFSCAAASPWAICTAKSRAFRTGSGL